MSSHSTRILLAMAALVGTLGTVEAIGRWGLTEAPIREDGLVSDAGLGWALPAGQVVTWHGTQGQVNSLGFRSPEPTGNGVTQRILIVGDSSVFGDGVSDAQTLPAQVSQHLMSTLSVDVQNGGVPGYSCIQTQAQVALIRDRFEPEVLVTYNMLSDHRLAEPHDTVVVDHQLGPLASLGIGKLMAALVLHLRVWEHRPNLEVVDYEQCMVEILQAQASAGGRSIVVLPFTDTDFPDNPNFGQPDPSTPGTRLSDYRAALRAVAKSAGAQLVDGPALAQASGLSQTAALQDMVHPTPRGHSLIAEAIARAIRPEQP
jgi:lysophospholipase L1-like esterase